MRFLLLILFLVGFFDGFAGQLRPFGCGFYGLDPLKINDVTFQRYPFPWMVALYYRLELVCGGTIGEFFLTNSGLIFDL
jgi:hypothetical protein